MRLFYFINVSQLSFNWRVVMDWNVLDQDTVSVKIKALLYKETIYIRSSVGWMGKWEAQYTFLICARPFTIFFPKNNNNNWKTMN